VEHLRLLDSVGLAPWDSYSRIEKAEERVSVPNLLVYVCMRGNTASLPL
jgi:hypothetical protein